LGLGEIGRERTSIPDLSLDGLVVDIDAPGRKLDTDGRLGLEIELVSCESREYCIVSYAKVTRLIELTVTVGRNKETW
jgi:hypothetical protein